MMNGPKVSGHEVRIDITVQIIPHGKIWKSGQLFISKRLQLPIELFEWKSLVNYIYALEKEVEHGLQTAGKEE